MRQRREFNERRTPLTEHYYRSQFRFNEATVDYLVDTFLGPGSGETRSGALSNKKKMEITLRYMADPGFMNSVAEVVGVSQPTVSITVSAVVNAICAKAHEWIIFPQNTQEVAFDLSTSTMVYNHIPDKKGHRVPCLVFVVQHYMQQNNH